MLKVAERCIQASLITGSTVVQFEKTISHKHENFTSQNTYEQYCTSLIPTDKFETQKLCWSII